MERPVYTSTTTTRGKGKPNTSNYTFTAPVTGRYQLSCALKINNIDKDSDYYSANIDAANTGVTIFAVKTPYLFSEDTNYHQWIQLK